MLPTPDLLLDAPGSLRTPVADIDATDPTRLPLLYTLAAVQAQPEFCTHLMRMRAASSRSTKPLWAPSAFTAFAFARRLMTMYGSPVPPDEEELELLTRKTTIALAWRCTKTVLRVERATAELAWSSPFRESIPRNAFDLLGTGGYWIPLGSGFCETGLKSRDLDDWIEGVMFVHNDASTANTQRREVDMVVLTYNRRDGLRETIATLPLFPGAGVADALDLKLMAGQDTTVNTLSIDTYQRLVALLFVVLPIVAAAGQGEESPEYVQSEHELGANFPISCRVIDVAYPRRESASPAAPEESRRRSGERAST